MKYGWVDGTVLNGGVDRNYVPVYLGSFFSLGVNVEEVCTPHDKGGGMRLVTSRARGEEKKDRGGQCSFGTTSLRHVVSTCSVSSCTRMRNKALS